MVPPGEIFRVSFLELILNQVSKLSKNFETGYDNLLRNNRLLFSRTIDYCTPLLFEGFCNLIIPKHGIEMQIFCLKMLWRFLTLFWT